MDTFKDGKLAAVQNPDKIWVNTEVFREEGKHWMKYGRYCDDPVGSPDYNAYWMEQRKRCLFGYSAGGVRIPGSYYFYLNFCPIQKVDVEKATGRTAEKVDGFPDFWDGDYNYYWVRDIARHGILKAMRHPIEFVRKVEENMEEEERLKIYEQEYEKLGMIYKPVIKDLEGGKDLIIGKSRRKGFSYKNASVAVANYFHRPNTYTLFMAYEKKYLFPGKKTIFGKAKGYINFINEHTAWAMPSDYINQQSHIKASYKETKNGKELEKGFKSELEAVSFKDNPDSGRGADAYDIIGEEVGAWGTPGGLQKTIAAMRSSTEGGVYKTGMMTLFGTSGDMEGGTIDFANLFKRPGANNFISFYDIWGKFPDKKEGFFFPRQVNLEGFYDKQGNSDMKGAQQFEEMTREALIKKGATSTEIQKKMQEDPLNSAEAFAMVATNNFPTVEIQSQLDKLEAKGWQDLKGTPIKWKRNEQGELEAKPILDGSKTPITSYYDIPINLEGCPVIYEAPVPNCPKGLYKIGYDPVRQDEGTSLASIIVYKGVHVGSHYRNIIVAEYIGRLETTDEIDQMASYFAEYFNTQVMYENEVKDTKTWFQRHKLLHQLAAQPDAVISKNIKKSKVARVYGCHMNNDLKNAGERYVRDWLLAVQDYDEHGNPIRVIDRIYSRRLLEELLSYHRKGNFDLISALFMALFQVQEEVLGKEYSDQKQNNTAKKLIAMTKKLHKNN